MTKDLRFVLDVTLFAALLAAFNPAVTGIAVHEWLCLAIVPPALVHLIVNWDLVVRWTVTFFERMRTASRVNLIVDAALFIASVTVMLSGFMVSQTIAGLFGIAVSPDAVWHVVHSWSATATILLSVLHGLLHWSWWASTVRWLLDSGQDVAYGPGGAAPTVRAGRDDRAVPVMATAVAPPLPTIRTQGDRHA